jgi:copper chaperone CopZ
MSKVVCSICYTKTATRIEGLYCERCLDELITELNSISRSDIKVNEEIKTIESEYFSSDKKKKFRLQ